ncbi:hypothetical protein ACFL56_03040 [Candidatus Margulisiibacteriota bacterium]
MKKPRKKKYKHEYITDEKGKKIAVVLPIEHYSELMEDLQDLAVIAERKDSKTIPYSEFLKKLKRNGKI